jgi:hypothetical protein
MQPAYSYYAYYKKLLKSRAVVGPCKNFLLGAAAGLHSRKKKITGNIAQDYLAIQ